MVSRLLPFPPALLPLASGGMGFGHIDYDFIIPLLEPGPACGGEKMELRPRWGAAPSPA